MIIVLPTFIKSFITYYFSGNKWTYTYIYCPFILGFVSFCVELKTGWFSYDKKVKYCQVAGVELVYYAVFIIYSYIIGFTYNYFYGSQEAKTENQEQTSDSQIDPVA